jgi:hypothetical protein
VRVSPTFPYGLVFIFTSIASILLVIFIKDMCVVTPALKSRLLSISRIHRRYLSPYIDSATDRRSSKPVYCSFLVIFVIGVVLAIVPF